MRASRLTLLLAVLVAHPVLAQRGPALRSPDVQPDRRVTFRLSAPTATDVRVSGDFLAAPQALTRDERCVWSVTVGPIAPEIYGYQLSVNGVTTTRGSLVVPGATPMFYDQRPVPHGAVEQRWYDSKSLQLTRRAGQENHDFCARLNPKSGSGPVGIRQHHSTGRNGRLAPVPVGHL